jgi:hypothetical protein
MDQSRLIFQLQNLAKSSMLMLKIKDSNQRPRELRVPPKKPQKKLPVPLLKRAHKR